jgi:two-component system invasion response regulator UvrY
MINILIVDDHAIVRKGLYDIVADASDMEVRGEASSGREALSMIRKNHYDVIVLDISLPDINGLDVLKQIQKEDPELPVLMLTMHPEEQYAVRAFKAGASGYLTKRSIPEELIQAIRKTHEGGRYVSLSLADTLISHIGPDSEKPAHDALSDREYQIMLMLTEGKKIKEIGEQLFISEKTVSTYRSRILDKMGLKSNVELARYVMENHLKDY